MRFTCQSCGRAYAVSDELSGRAFKMKCKACGQEIVVRPADPGSGRQAETTGVRPLPVPSPLIGRFLLLLTTVGRKSGLPRVTPLVYEQQADTIIKSMVSSILSL